MTFNRKNQIDFKGLNEAALKRCPGLLEQLLPGGRVEGHYYVCGSLSGGAGDSVKVNLTTGQWREWNSGAPIQGSGGDIISLVACVLEKTQGEAARWLADKIGYPVTTTTRVNTKPEKKKPEVICPVPDDAPSPPDTQGERFAYRDEEGRLLGYRDRVESGERDKRGKQNKNFYPRSYTGEGWESKGLPKPWPFFGLETIKAHSGEAKIVVVEGERKCVIARGLIDNNKGAYVVLSLYSGSLSAPSMDYGPLQSREVIYWPDNDPAGFKCALAFAEHAGKVAASVKIVIPPGDVKETWDLGDAIRDDGWNFDQVVSWLNGHSVSPEEFAKHAGGKSPELAPQSAEAWDEPIYFENELIPDFDYKVLPEALAEYVRALAEELQVPPELLCMMTLASLAVAAQAKYRVFIKGDYYQPLNLFLICALDPANRKSAVVNAVIEPLRAWEKEARERLLPEIKKRKSERITMERAIEGIRKKVERATNGDEIKELQIQIESCERDMPSVPNLPRLLAADITPEACGHILAEHGESLGIISAEAGAFEILCGGFYSRGVPNLDLVLKSYENEPVYVDRRNGEPIIINKPKLTLAFTPQNICLTERRMGKVFRGRGLDGRFLYFIPRSLLGKRAIETRPVPDEIKQTFRDNIYEILGDWDGTPVEPITLALNEKARQAWVEFAESIEKRLAPGGEFESFSDWAGKLSGTVARVAGLFHLVERSDVGECVINEDTMGRACAFGALAIEHAKRAYGLMAGVNDYKVERRLLDWINKHFKHSFSDQEAWQGVKNSCAKKSQLDAALNELKNHNFIRQCEESVRKRQGRPGKPHYEVNPMALERKK